MKIISLFILLFGVTMASFDQNDNLPFDVNRINPSFAIEKDELYSANTLMDLNAHYKPSWVKSYIAVEIQVIHKGETIKVVGENATLTAEQKEMIRMADDGHGIQVNIEYIPENTLKHNEPKFENFTLSVLPDQEAQFPGGKDELTKYLYQSVVSTIKEGVFTGYDLAAVKFNIDETGQVQNVQLFESSKDESLDELLVASIEQMPKWSPAVYSSGVKVAQEFAFTVGNLENCLVSVLNIR